MCDELKIVCDLIARRACVFNFLPSCPPRFLADQQKISDHQQNWGYEDGPWKGPGPSLLVAADFKKFFNLCFIGHVGFDEHRTD